MKDQRFTGNQYLRMIELGILPESSVELIAGQLYHKNGGPYPLAAGDYLRLVKTGLLTKDEAAVALRETVAEFERVRRLLDDEQAGQD